MMKYDIPFNKPFIVGKELYYIAQSVMSGHIAGDGIFTKKCQRFVEKKFNVQKVLLTTSCTAALEMAAILCKINPGDEVILPSFTFVSTANAFHLRKAKLKFVDIRPDTLNIDESRIEDQISHRTKAVVPVHYAGIGCEMKTICEIASRNNIYVIEDSAQGINSKYEDQYLGTIGDIGTYSFHETKNVICGEGGAILLNSDEFIERSEIIREKGTNRSKFFRGEVDKYTWVDIGSSYLPSDILAAFLFAQLENIDQISDIRKKIFEKYYRQLTPLKEKGLIELPKIPENCVSNYHLFYVITESESVRDRLMDYLKAKGILSVFHYLPLHLSKIGRSEGYKEGDFPITESLSGRLLRLPFFYDLTDEDIMKVTNNIYAFFKA